MYTTGTYNTFVELQNEVICLKLGGIEMNFRYAQKHIPVETEPTCTNFQSER